jgi:SAM-dependent methyltransferase
MTVAEDLAYVEYPEYYDHAHGQTLDIPFYLHYARECGSPILELACGTGRLVLPLARAGYRITGVDLAPGMLAICRGRVEEAGIEDRVSLTQADMAGFDLSEKAFALAFIALRSFTHLFRQEDQLACLERVHEHLRPGGMLIIAVFALNHRVAAQDEDGLFSVLREFDLPDARHVIQWQRFIRYDAGNQIMYHEFKFEERDREGRRLRERTVPMTMRYTSRYELQLLLERVGFEVIDVFRDYDMLPYNGKYEIIMVSRKTC